MTKYFLKLELNKSIIEQHNTTITSSSSSKTTRYMIHTDLQKSPLVLFSNKVCVGIQSRLHRLNVELSSPGSRSSFFKDADYEKVRKSLEQKFPKRDQAMKERGWEKFSEVNKSRQIIQELETGYLIIKDCCRFQEYAISIINSSTGSLLHPRGTIINWDSLLSSAQEKYMDLLCNYAKIHYQVQKMKEDLKTIASGYASAYYIVNGREEDFFANISNYLSKYAGDVSSFKTCLGDFNDNGSAVAEVASQIFERITPIFVDSSPASSPTNNPNVNPNNINNSHWIQTSLQAFDLNGVSHDISMPADLGKCVPIIMREKMRGWVVWGLLVCPSAFLLQSPITTSSGNKKTHEVLFKKIISENVVETVFRDQTIRIHELFHELYSSYPSKQQEDLRMKFKDALGDTKIPKLISLAIVETTKKSGLIHKERRIFLTQSIHAITLNLLNSPGLIGPKIANILAVLAASKDELTWYFLHLPNVCPPPKQPSFNLLDFVSLTGGGDAKYVKEEWIDSANVAVLISVHMRLFSLICQNFYIAKMYASDWLTKCPSLTDEVKYYDDNFHRELIGGNQKSNPEFKKRAGLVEFDLLKKSFGSGNGFNVLQNFIRLNFYISIYSDVEVSELVVVITSRPFYMHKFHYYKFFIFYF